MVEPAAGDLDNPPKKFRGESSAPLLSPGCGHSPGPAGGSGWVPAALMWSVEPPSAKGCLLVRVASVFTFVGARGTSQGRTHFWPWGPVLPRPPIPGPPRHPQGSLRDWVFPEDLLSHEEAQAASPALCRLVWGLEPPLPSSLLPAPVVTVSSAPGGMGDSGPRGLVVWALALPCDSGHPPPRSVCPAVRGLLRLPCGPGAEILLPLRPAREAVIVVTPCEAEAGRRILGVVGRVGAGRDTPGGAVCLPTWLLLGERSAGIVPRGMQLTEGAGFKRALRPPGLSAKGVGGLARPSEYGGDRGGPPRPQGTHICCSASIACLSGLLDRGVPGHVSPLSSPVWPHSLTFSPTPGPSLVPTGTAGVPHLYQPCS